VMVKKNKTLKILRGTNMPVAEIVIFLFIGFVIVSVMKAVYFVPKGFEYTIERFGHYTVSLAPGLGIRMPWPLLMPCFFSNNEFRSDGL